MKRRSYFLLFIAFFITHLIYGQSSYVPKNLGSPVNSVYSEINPVLSPDGKTLYFVRVNHPENTFGYNDSEDIWFSEWLTDGTWSEPKRIVSLNIGRYNAILSLSADGNTALINGIYTRRGTFWKKRGLSISTRSETGWSTPVKLKIPSLSRRNRGKKSSGMMTPDGQYIVVSFSRDYNSKKTNLFYCKRKNNGNYSRPQAIHKLNVMTRSEDSPFLQADNKTLYYSTNYQRKGNYDIYKAVRISDGWKRWSAPEKLNDTINSEGWEGYFKMNTKGSWAYFSSTEKSIGGADIYKVKIKEENPFVIVSGRILHEKSKRPLVGKAIKMMVNGSFVDSISYNPDSATYKIKLPLSKLYSLSAQVENYSPVPAKIDVQTAKEFMLVKQDLLERPLPYVLVRGKLLSSGSNQRIPASANPKIFINGVLADSATLLRDGTYAVKVKYGTVNKMVLKADKYESLPTSLDLSRVDEYKEIPFDLYVNEEQVASIVGKILDKKTGNPVHKSKHVSIRVEGLNTVWATVDSTQGTYELKLPVGKTYTISASAMNYYPLYETLDIGQERSNVKIFKDLTIVPIEVGQSIRINNIFFETGKAALKSSSFPELDRVAKFLIENPDIKIEIGGHTDNVGKEASNMKLSQARADAVALYLISKGAAATNVVSKGYGLTKPVATNATAIGKAQNRRVEFTIMDK